MTKFDFHDARRKLTRARDHIQDAEKALLSLANPELYRFDTQRDYENQRVRIELVTLHKPNKTFSCIAGDAIGNLRSVLDYVIVAMLKPINGRIDNVGFPSLTILMDSTAQ